MDPHDLKTASNLVNNMLASRGLLRGDSINFAKPGRDDSSAAKIINLVHELVQRRDREAEQRENLATSIRSLRDSEVKQSSTIDSLRASKAELERKVALLEGQARTFNSTLQNVESSAKSARDDSARIKMTLSQVRMQCANDIRKRDIQIQKMKERITDTRGRGIKPPLSQIVIKSDGVSKGAPLSSFESGEMPSLSQDTVEHFKATSQYLADQNNKLTALLRQALSTLRRIQGLPDDMRFTSEENSEDAQDCVIAAAPFRHEEIRMQMDAAMLSLRKLLTQANRVPIERDAEILSLTQKVETLQEEWQKAINLLDSWNQRHLPTDMETTNVLHDEACEEVVHSRTLAVTHSESSTAPKDFNVSHLLHVTSKDDSSVVNVDV